MARTEHWHDTDHYALRESHGTLLPVNIAGGGGLVLLDGPQPDVDAAIAELVNAGCPIVKSEAEEVDLMRESRGRPQWDLVGSASVGLWRDRWGGIWLKSQGIDPVAGAMRLSKYEAMGLAEKLLALARAAPP